MGYPADVLLLAVASRFKQMLIDWVTVRRLPAQIISQQICKVLWRAMLRLSLLVSMVRKTL